MRQEHKMATLRCTRVHDNKSEDDYMNLTIIVDTRELIIDIDMSLAMFTSLITGQSLSDCSIIFRYPKE